MERNKKMKTQTKLSEADYWDELLLNESIEEFEQDLRKAERLNAKRPPKVNVTMRMDPNDLSLLKRKANKLGIPYSQIIASIVHQALRNDRMYNH